MGRRELSKSLKINSKLGMAASEQLDVNQLWKVVSPKILDNREISLKILERQNIALVTRTDHLRAETVNLQKKCQSIEAKFTNYRTFFTCFMDAWQNFLKELENSYIMLKNPNNEKLLKKFEESFNYMDLVMKLGQKALAMEEDNSKNMVKETEKFMKNLSNIFTDLFILNQTSQERIKKKYEEILESETNDSARKLFHENKVSSEKIKELENQINEAKQSIIKLKQHSFANVSREEIIEENCRLKEINENLLRRLRIIAPYNHLDASEKAEYESRQKLAHCVCGADLIQTYIYSYDTLNESLLKDVKLLTELSKTKVVEAMKIENPEVEEPKIKEEEPDAKLNEKVSELENQLQYLWKENAKLMRKNADLNAMKANLDEMFYNSKLFENLVQQTQEIMKYSANLRTKLLAANKKIFDIENLRLVEIKKITEIASQEKEALQEEILRLKKENLERKIFSTEEISKIINFSEHTKKWQDILNLSDQNMTTLTNENQNLLKLMEEYRMRFEQEQRENQENKDRVLDLNVQLTTLRNQLPNFLSYENLSYRHGHHKAVVEEVLRLISSHNPSFKSKFDDLINYMKSREAKIEGYESKLKGQAKDIERQKEQISKFVQEILTTRKSYQETNEKNKKLIQNLKEQEEMFSNLMNDKLSEKSQFEQHKTLLEIKMKADKEVFKTQSMLIAELKNQEEALSQQVKKSQEEVMEVNIQLEEIKIEKSELLDKIEDLTKHLNLVQKKLNDVEKIEQKMLEDYQKYMSSSKTMNQPPEVRHLKHEISLLRDKILCSVCKKQEKDRILMKCLHMLCQNCITNSQQYRSRACPIDRQKFSQEDIKPIYWT